MRASLDRSDRAIFGADAAALICVVASPIRASAGYNAVNVLGINDPTTTVRASRGYRVTSGGVIPLRYGCEHIWIGKECQLLPYTSVTFDTLNYV